MAARAAQHYQDGHNYQTFQQVSSSMAPSIDARETVLVDFSAYQKAGPVRGDVVVFTPPVPSLDEFLKRIVAVPGDRIAISKGDIIVNGISQHFSPEKPQYDLRLHDAHIEVNDGAGWERVDHGRLSPWPSPRRLPARCYFVLGDHVNNSEDSHIWGCVDLSGQTHRVGKATWNLSRDKAL